MDVLTDVGFYVTLPSNASKDVFKNNTSSSYTVDLAKAIELNGEWVVGLCEVIYPHSWYTLPRDLSYFELNKTMDEPQPLVIQKFGWGGYYDKPKELLEQIIPYLRKYNPTVDASYNVTKCIDFKGSGQYKIRVCAPLTYMLGLKDGEWWNLSHRSAPYPCDLKTGIYNLFVYTDIIQYQQPHLKTAASNIASDVVKQALGKITNQEGSGGIMVLSRRARRRPPGDRVSKKRGDAKKRKSVKSGKSKCRKSARTADIF
ncbi:hypothetical protein LDENG_00216670 [Lucifuga dentata]|nr:hypothetical protein LDENG_00216670 [Lucifuga dentata]